MNNKKLIVIIVIVVLLLLSQNWLLKTFDKVSYPKRYEILVLDGAQLYGVNEELIYAIMKAESGFFPYARSAKNARGLMQLSENTWNHASQKLGFTSMDIYDKQSNIRGGAWYLSTLLKEFQNEDLAIIAYNAGPTKVREWMRLGFVNDKEIQGWTIPYKETETYLYRVRENKEKYLEIYDLDGEVK